MHGSRPAIPPVNEWPDWGLGVALRRGVVAERRGADSAREEAQQHGAFGIVRVRIEQSDRLPRPERQLAA